MLHSWIEIAPTKNLHSVSVIKFKTHKRSNCPNENFFTFPLLIFYTTKYKMKNHRQFSLVVRLVKSFVTDWWVNGQTTYELEWANEKENKIFTCSVCSTQGCSVIGSFDFGWVNIYSLFVFSHRIMYDKMKSMLFTACFSCYLIYILSLSCIFNFHWYLR